MEEADHLFVDESFKNFTKAIQKTYWSIIIHKTFSNCLCSGMTLALLKSSGKVDELIHELYNIDSGCIRTLLHTLITLGLISSGPLALLTFSFSISSRTGSIVRAPSILYQYCICQHAKFNGSFSRQI